MIDQLVSQAIIWLRNPFLDKFFLLVTTTGNAPLIILGGFLVSVFLIVTKKKHHFFAIFSVYSFSLFFIYILKKIISRPRPPLELSLITETGFSMPSGHSYFAITFYGFLTYYFVHYLTKKWQKIAVSILGITHILLLAFSRIYLGVHWLSDVLVGLLVGFVWLATVILFLNKKNSLPKKNQVVDKKLANNILRLFVVVWLVALLYYYQKNLKILGTKIINPISAATTEINITAPAAKSRASVVSE